MSQYDPHTPKRPPTQNAVWHQAQQMAQQWQNAQDAQDSQDAQAANGSGPDNPIEASFRSKLQYRQSTAYQNIWRVYYGTIFALAALMIGFGVYGAIAGTWYMLACIPLGIVIGLSAVSIRKRQTVVLTQGNQAAQWALDQSKAMRQSGMWGSQPPTGGQG